MKVLIKIVRNLTKTLKEKLIKIIKTTDGKHSNYFLDLAYF